MFLPDMHVLNLWKIKTSKTVLNAFFEIVNESNGKPNTFWVDHGRQFYNKLM